MIQLIKKWSIPIGSGMLYAIVAILLSQVLLRNAGAIAFGFGADAQIAAILGALQTAPMASPWLAGLLFGAVGGGLLGFLPSRKARLWVGIGAGLLLLLPCIAAAALFTEVNTIRLWNVLRSVLPYLGMVAL